jgi:hypothetical protein
MREETFVFRSDDCVTDNPRELLVLCEPPVLSCQFYERLAVGIVNGADGRKLKADKWLNVRQRGSIKIDVMDSDCNESGCKDCCANGKVPDTPPPIKSA